MCVDRAAMGCILGSISLFVAKEFTHYSSKSNYAVGIALDVRLVLVLVGKRDYWEISWMCLTSMKG